MPHLLAKAWETLRDEGLAAAASKTARKLRFWWEISRLPYVTTVPLADGGTLRLYVNTLFSRHWYSRGRADSPELAWIHAALRPGDVALDVGANNGFTGILFARRVGQGGRVIGFEPGPANVAAARENIRLNQVDNFELVVAAVGAAPGRVRFEPGFGNGAIAQATGTIEVPMVTLDAHCAGRRVDFVKIDVEGFEIDVLRGARAVLQQRPALAIEIHVGAYAEPERQVAELLALLPLEDYDALIQLEVDGPLAAFDRAVHTPSLIARHHNVHWLGRPRSPH